MQASPQDSSDGSSFPDLRSLTIINLGGQIGVSHLSLDGQGALEAGSTVFGDTVTGTWDDVAQQLTMERQFDRSSRDVFEGFILATLADGSIALAGQVTSFDQASISEINGWYAVADASHLWLDPPPQRIPPPADLPVGVFQMNDRGTLKILNLNFSSENQNEAPSLIEDASVSGTIDDASVSGTWDPVFGSITFILDFGRGSTDEYIGFVMRTPDPDRLAIAGHVTSFDGPRTDSIGGWYGIYKRDQINQPILETFRDNPLSVFGVPTDTSNPLWPVLKVGGKRFLLNDEPLFEWVPILADNWEFEILNEQLVGISGTAVLSRLSNHDIPFTHPFADDADRPAHPYGRFGDDFEFFIAPDTPYYNLMAVTDLDVGRLAPWFKINAEVQAAITQANDQKPADLLSPGGLNLAVPGVLGVEIDQGLIPKVYRPQDGDRVAVFGRWIVDAGHDTFETEIHPPLVAARAFQPLLRSSTGGIGIVSPDPDVTHSTLIGRPYLVSQIFSSKSDTEEKGLRKHIISALSDAVRSKILGHPTVPNFIRADAPILYGIAAFEPLTVTYIVRPPSIRRSPDDQLLASFHFIVHSGVTLSVTRTSLTQDEVQVNLTLTGNGHEVSLKSQEAIITADDLIEQLDPSDQQAVRDFLQAEVTQTRQDHGDSAADYLQHLIDAGVHMKFYDQPLAESPYDKIKVVQDVPISQLPILGSPASGGEDLFRGTITYDGQPFPVYGWLNLRWQRAPGP